MCWNFKFFNIKKIFLIQSFWMFIGFSAFTTSIAKGIQKLPEFPSNLASPPEITFDCINESRNLPTLELCRANLEKKLDQIEEYNKKIKRFCDSLTNYDNKLRTEAKSKKLSWNDYEEIKNNQLKPKLDECNSDDGEYYAPYRARMREYKQAQQQHDIRRGAIYDQMDI